MFLLSIELWTSTHVWCLENRSFLSYSLCLKKKKENCVCVRFVFFPSLFNFPCRISHAIFKLASLKQGLTAASWVIIREQAEGPFKISVLNNHTQDLTPNEMMRGSHRSCQISAACFALLWRLKPPCLACAHTNRNTHTQAHTHCQLVTAALLMWKQVYFDRWGMSGRRAQRNSCCVLRWWV